LTYSEFGERLGSSPEAARSLARRLRLVRKPGNDGTRLGLEVKRLGVKMVDGGGDGSSRETAGVSSGQPEHQLFQVGLHRAK
jgi:hypothetical protein